MKIYSILLFLVFLNLTIGFTFGMINDGEFLPEAQGVLKTPASSSSMMEHVNNVNANIKKMFDPTSDDYNILTIIEGGIGFLTEAGGLFLTIVTTPSDMLSELCGAVGISVPDYITNILKIGMTLITSMTIIQLVTGKWFSFVE